VAGLYGDGPLQATQVDQWIDFLPALAAGPGFPAACAYIDSYLALRTMLVGNQLSVADLLIWGHLKSTLPRPPHLSRLLS
jgi:glutamyl-tRNA synthetase